MRRLILVGFICGLIGFVLGNAFWYLASPLWIDREVSESFEPGVQAQVTATGQFTGADAIHSGTGTVQAIDTGTETVLRFTEFEVTNGPDLYVWLVRDGNIQRSADVKNSEWVDLGLLKGNIGDQNYALPNDVDVSQYKSVVVWCKMFGVLFASAPLTPGS